MEIIPNIYECYMRINTIVSIRWMNFAIIWNISDSGAFRQHSHDSPEVIQCHPSRKHPLHGYLLDTWGVLCQKQVSRSGTSKFTVYVGCNYLSLPLTHATAQSVSSLQRRSQDTYYIINFISYFGYNFLRFCVETHRMWFRCGWRSAKT